MEPIRKRAKITGHFRVALKPQDVNIQPGVKKLKLLNENGKENVEVITISDDEDDDFKNNKKEVNRVDSENSNKKENNYDDENLKQIPHVPEQNAIDKKFITRKPTVTTSVAGATASISAGTAILNNTINNNNNNNTIESLLTGDNHQLAKKRKQFNTLANLFNIRAKTKCHNIYFSPPGITPHVVDHDKSLLDDILYEPHYAWDSFKYDREQELKYNTRRYLEDVHHNNQITPLIRARLVDWLVQIQSTYSLYHEPLYMAVKIADHYLMQKTVPRHQLQLLYMTAILIAAKFDERLPPVEIDDLIQQTAGVYTREQVINFEADILTTLNFNIRFPLSYVFLRRFARCTRSDQRTLLLARFILESSLLDYEMIEVLDSKMAAASLLLAFHMLHLDDAWNETAVFYTGYKQEELDNLMQKLNQMIARPTDKRISTVRHKYSHEVFLSVATIAPVSRI